MIPVIPFSQFGNGFLCGISIGFSQFVDALFETCCQFLFRDAAYCHISVVHGYVRQIVEVAEHAHLAKLGDSCDECELYVFVLSLQYGVEGLELVAVFLLQLRVA